MKVSFIQANANKAPFKGLWGVTRYDNQRIGSFTVDINTTTRHYYPFKDENPDKIKEIKSRLESDNTDEEYTKARKENSWAICSVFNVKVHKPLEFTEEDYNAFKEDPKCLSDEVYGRIATATQKNGLGENLQSVF